MDGVYEILKFLSRLISTTKADRAERQEIADNAIRAICNALSETKIYYSKNFLNDQEKREAEEYLCRLWAATAVPVRHLDRELAFLCDRKSGFWLDPSQWNDKRIEKEGIGLDELHEKYENMLKER